MGDCLWGDCERLHKIAGTPDRHRVGSYKKSRQVQVYGWSVPGDFRRYDNGGLAPLETLFYMPGIAGHLVFWTGVK